MAEGLTQCPVETAIQIIGGKWKLLILRSLLLNGPQRYNEILGSVTAISQKELTRNLKELGNSGLVAQDSATNQVGRYDVTKLGKGLMPAFKKLLTWGAKLPASQ
jgi:DNA-binding HxlR family transcriptional regulator